MNRERIVSSAKIPSQFYVERAADFQLRSIINDMARPGYVLVARQMGKTNLLLHTKEKYQSDSELYVYIDFSTMVGFTEDDCLNYFIDTAIELNWEKFEKAESQIQELRDKSNYKASKMFTRELRILLKYVDKIVFILDEIDALTRREYSDHIFSLIRGHYFASTNFPELKKATFILSGVIEPKDIIKDNNISPFNIGEKIYLLDFSYDEFKRLTQNFRCLKFLAEPLIERLFYWTKGQPRISWDLCEAANNKAINTIEGIDNLVYNLYLKFFDRAPIDSIREMATNDSALRDAIIQLAINKGDTLAPQVKSRLYLAGIINWEEGANNFKNPIMAKSLSYEWLMQLQKKEMNFLAEAEKSIELDKEYRKGISMLKRFIDSKPSGEDKDRAYYYLALAYYRVENYDESIKWQELMEEDSVFFYQGLLLKAINLSAQGKFDLSNNILNQILKKENYIEKETYLRCATTIISNDLFRLETFNTKWDDMSEYETILDRVERLLNSVLSKYVRDITQLQMYALFKYYNAIIYSFKGEVDNCLTELDVALMFATSNEKPWLLYKKLCAVSEFNKGDIAKVLYDSLVKISSKSIKLENDSIIELNIIYVSEILAVLMLDYPDLDVSPLLRAFWFESKENAIIIVYKILQKRNFSRTNEFLSLILHLTEEDQWLFSLENEVVLATNALQLLNDSSYANKLIFDSIEKELPLNEVLVNLIENMTEIYKEKSKPHKIIELTNLYYLHNNKKNDVNSIRDINIRYNECRAYLSLEREIDYLDKAEFLLKLIKEVKETADDSFFTGYTKEKIVTISIDLESKIKLIKRRIKGVKSLNNMLCQGLKRNQRMAVFSYKTGEFEEGKFKNFEKNLKLGYCKIIRIE